MPTASELVIDLAHDSFAERDTRDHLLALMDVYPLERWRYADHIRISDGEIPHSHPVLTIASYPDRQHPLRLLSSYIHEQLHWFWLLETHGDRPVAAMSAFEEAFPGLPIGAPNGCRSAFSNLLHIAINFWELQGMADLIGDAPARAFIAGKPHYRAIYRLALDRTAEIAAILGAHDLVVPAAPPEHPRFVIPDH